MLPATVQSAGPGGTWLCEHLIQAFLGEKKSPKGFKEKHSGSAEQLTSQPRVGTQTPVSKGGAGVPGDTRAGRSPHGPRGAAVRTWRPGRPAGPVPTERQRLFLQTDPGSDPGSERALPAPASRVPNTALPGRGPVHAAAGEAGGFGHPPQSAGLQSCSGPRPVCWLDAGAPPPVAWGQGLGKCAVGQVRLPLTCT